MKRAEVAQGDTKMTMTEISEAQISREEYEAALARLHAYSDKVKTVMADAARGSMAAAADMTQVFESKFWADELLSTHPIKTAHRRGQPVKPDSIERFALWVQQNQDRIGDVYSANRISKMMSANRIAIEYLGPQAEVFDVGAVAPLKSFMKDRQTELPVIAKRIKEITDGGTITESVVKRAIRDHNQSIIPAKVARAPGRKTTADHAAIIRAEFRILLNSKRFRDAGALLNELRAELMTAAGVTDDH